MIERYTLPDIGKIWSDEIKYSKWLQIELLVCEALTKRGEIPLKSFKNIKKKAKFNLNRILEIEEEVKHDVIAFLSSIAENVGKDSRYIHRGLTSSDVLDTGLALQMKDAADIILNDIEKIVKILRNKAKKNKDLIMIGRTHGIHAEPTTFGLKLAIWWKEMERNYIRMKRAKEIISFGKISGAVGTYSNIDPSIESYVCRKLKLKPSPVSTQIIQRDRHAEYLSVIAIIGSSLDKFATEIRHLQKTEVLELEEPFEKGQKGSSAMPHKRNPIICERISGLARILRANATVGFENIPLWHERDITHSSAERVIIPDSTILLHYMLKKFIYTIENLQVYPENMKENLDRTKGLMFSQKVLIALTKKEISREKAYKIVQDNAMKVWRKEGNFKELLLSDCRVTKYLNPAEIQDCFNIHSYLKNVKSIYKRLKI
ncbi:MAG: adenylosuccinate lyase [Candidatus Firestonebacteria bacterium]